MDARKDQSNTAISDYELTPKQVIYAFIEMEEVMHQSYASEKPYKIRIRKFRETQAFEFVSAYRNTKAWYELKHKAQTAQTDMTREEFICYALITEDVKLVNVHLLDRFRYNLPLFKVDNDQVRYLSLSLECMSAALHYQQNPTDNALAKLNMAFQNRAQIVSPIPVYLNLSQMNFSGIILKNQGIPYANLEKINFENARLDLAGLAGGFYCSNLACSNLQNAKIENCGSALTNFSRSNLSKLKADNTSFLKCNFTSADLSESEIGGMQFDENDMTDANMNAARIRGSLCGIKLNRTSIVGTELRHLIYHAEWKDVRLIEPSECSKSDDLAIALSRVAWQLETIMKNNKEHPHHADTYIKKEQVLQSVIDNVLDGINKNNLTNKAKNEILDYLIDHSLIAGDDLLDTKNAVPVTVNYVFKMFDKALGYEKNSHRIAINGMQQQLLDAKWGQRKAVRM